MNKKQYNNVIDNTLKHDKSAQTGDSLSTARLRLLTLFGANICLNRKYYM